MHVSTANRNWGINWLEFRKVICVDQQITFVVGGLHVCGHIFGARISTLSGEPDGEGVNSRYGCISHGCWASVCRAMRANQRKR